MNAPDCVFCKICAGTVPSTRVVETPDVLAFMDIGPVAKGHVLVIPRQHHNPITETPPEVLHQVITVVRLIARAQIKGLSATGVNVTQANGAVAGQAVPHLHFHVIPRHPQDAAERNWLPGSYSSPDEMRRYADRIRQALDPA